MFIKLNILFVLGLILAHASSTGEELTPSLGKTISSHEVESINITVLPDGRGLPKGEGSAKQGEALYQTKCQSCHGINGIGGLVYALAGKPKQGIDWSVGSSWPYATSIYSYIRRAMPPFSPKTLTENEVYALTAYILYLNGLAPLKKMQNQDTLTTIKMPALQYTSSKWEKSEKHVKE